MADIEEQRRKVEELKRKILEQKKKSGEPQKSDEDRMRQEAEVKIKVTDEQGRPVRAEVSLAPDPQRPSGNSL